MTSRGGGQSTSPSALPAIYESGQADDGTPYIAMEFLEGESLRQALARRGAPVSRREKAGWFEPVGALCFDRVVVNFPGLYTRDRQRAVDLKAKSALPSEF